MRPRRPARPSLIALSLLGLLGAVIAGRPAAQEAPVGLIADRIAYDETTGVIAASGNVEVLYQGRILRAAEIRYDTRAETIRATGPIVLVDPAGGVLLADAAALTPDLADGLIEGARVLIGEQLQLAAVEGRRSGGRFATLDRVVASSCTICAGDPTPTWAIRAERVTQDPVAQRIYFENASLQLFGLPVAYVPRLSIPEPGVERASGFLPPELSSSQIYGLGLKQPYYRVLSPSSDYTLTPFVTSQGGLLAEGEYRRRFAEGGFSLGGIVALDDGLDADIGGDGLRWSLEAAGDFALDRGYVAEFDVSLVGDDVFLKQFDYSDDDLLTSTARIRRTRAKDDFRLEIIAFQSLLPDEDSASVPTVLPDFAYRRLREAPVIGGQLAYDLQALGITRDAGDTVLRATGGLDWSRSWTLPAGLLVEATAAAAIDGYGVLGDAGAGDELFARTTPLAMLDLRWPLLRRDPGADHVIEPIAQVILSDSIGDTEPPNEDSTLTEFTYANLFSTNRFAGRDRLETGLRSNLGVRYTRYDPDGWELGVSLGRVLRASDLDQFPGGSGLNGRWSDYVGAVTLEFDWGLDLSNRLLVDESLGFTRNELSVGYAGAAGGLSASYVYLAEDTENAELGPQDETSELALAARYRLRPNWEVRGSWRYDLTNSSNLRAGGGITYGNECAEFDLSVSRRYTSSDNLPPSTSIGFGLRLAGLGASQTRDWPARTCVMAGLR